MRRLNELDRNILGSSEVGRAIHTERRHYDLQKRNNLAIRGMGDSYSSEIAQLASAIRKLERRRESFVQPSAW
jgi:hypothetical protein